MAPPTSSLLRRIFVAISVVCFCAATNATAFPLPVPTRPTSFPLQRPSQVGEVVAWGSNTFGEISIPPDLTNIVAVSTFGRHSLALRSDGTVVSWGDNTWGQTNVPAGLSDVVAISAGFVHSVALKSDGQVVAWGQSDGQVVLEGGKLSGPGFVPTNFPPAVAIAAGASHTIALKLDGTVTGWGSDQWGEALPPWVSSPSGAIHPTNVVAIAAGLGCSMALLSDNRFVGWPQFGEINFIEAASIAVGRDKCLVLRRDGIISPVNNVPLYGRAVAIAGGDLFTVALGGDGTVSIWSNDFNQPLNPLLIPPPRLRTVFAIAAGESHVVAVKIPSPAIPTQAKASAQIVNGFIVGLDVVDGGEGYATPPQVTITGGGGSGATATAQISKGVVTGFAIGSPGAGYTATPTITIDPPPFLPKLNIATSRVGVTMQVVPGKRYQLESSNDLPNFGPVGTPFVADKDTITQEFAVSETGQFFRIVEVP